MAIKGLDSIERVPLALVLNGEAEGEPEVATQIKLIRAIRRHCLSDHRKEMTAQDGDVHVLRVDGHPPLKVVVAASTAAVKQGLSGRPHLPSRQGLFFVFPSLERRAMWMPDMKFSLDIVWLDEHLSVVHVNSNVPPCEDGVPCENYSSVHLAKYAIEINAGEAKGLGLRPGAQIKLLT